MADSLTILKRIKKMELDEQQRILISKIKTQDDLIQKKQNLIDNYEKEKLFAAQNPLMCDFGAYTEQFLKKKQVLENKISNLEKEITQIRDAMADIFKEQKTFEILIKAHMKEKQKKLDEAEQKMLDEIGTNAYIKKHKNET